MEFLAKNEKCLSLVVPSGADGDDCNQKMFRQIQSDLAFKFMTWFYG